MKKLALNISKEFVKRDIISESDIEIYRYGLEIILTSTMTSLSVLALSIVLNSIGYGILYLLICVPLKITAGGYHADTYLKCFTISNLSYFILSLIHKIVEQNDVSPYIWLLILLSCAFYIFIKAPVQHPDQPLSPDKARNNKRLSAIYLGIDCLTITFLIILAPSSKVISFSALAILMVALFIIPTSRKGGHIK